MVTLFRIQITQLYIAATETEMVAFTLDFGNYYLNFYNTDKASELCEDNNNELILIYECLTHLSLSCLYIML